MDQHFIKDAPAGLPWAHLRLPPLPQVALRVLQLANNENVQLHQLSELISSDPAFASEVLTIVNSLVYAPRFPISSILQAIAVMGANHLQGLCLTVGVRGFMGRSLDQPAMRALWRHNLACATIAEQLASVGFMDRGRAFTCGVLHDIGRLGLAVARPKEYTEILGVFEGTPAAMLEREVEVFGRDHCALGKQLIGEWKLPEDFEPVVADHHAARESDGLWDMTDLISVSCRMADAVGFTAFPHCQTSAFADLQAELPHRERERFYHDLETLSAEIHAKISAIESV